MSIPTSSRSVKFVENEISFNLSEYPESLLRHGPFFEIREGFISLIWRNSLFATSYKGNVIRISTKGKTALWRKIRINNNFI